MKRSGFKTKHSALARTSRMRSFRKVEGEDVLQVDEADRRFSLEIRKRDGQCVHCGSRLFLGCSHYFRRAIYATRYDPLNCITLCQECHEKWELEKNGMYKKYMITRLGVIGFKSLEIASKNRVSPYNAIREWMRLRETLKDNGIEY